MITAETLCFIDFPSLGDAAEYSAILGSTSIDKPPQADVSFDLGHLKTLWKKRLLAIKDDGKLPIIDIESSFDPGAVSAEDYAKGMDKNAIALTAFSPQKGEKKYKKKGSARRPDKF